MKAIEFKEVEKSFQDGDQVVKALKETTMSIDKGEFVAIIGPSGSGKSTFLTLAGGLQTPSSGSVVIKKKVNALNYVLKKLALFCKLPIWFLF